ncbi:hypothetical protein [Flavobacterium sp. KJJ]|uniref:hypothetical protein n=1 Tax=Flavobacterium sp. KJJ TaxID=1270193 RepID=UPI0004935DAC|nr:hypothetical protein [Flavobacterium sp. KJJ]
MEKEKVLVRDNKGFFLKMFKKKFKDEFDFFESSFLLENENNSKDYDRSIFVVYDKFEMIEYLKLDKKEANVLVCLFNKQLYNSLSFLEEVKNLILLDSSKTRSQIISDLKQHFKMTLNLNKITLESRLQNTPILPTQFDNFCKALFFLM